MPDQSGVQPVKQRQDFYFILFKKQALRQRKERKKCNVYTLDHGFCPMSRPIFCSSLKDTSQDVDHNVTAQQTHYVWESWAESWRNWRTKSWAKTQTKETLVRLSPDQSTGDCYIRTDVVTFITSLLCPPLLLRLFCLQQVKNKTKLRDQQKLCQIHVKVV